MTWIDASFAIEWLGGTERASAVGLSRRARVWILPMQYAEVCVYFLRRDPEFSREALEALEALELVEPDASELLGGSTLYVHARAQGSKASLADAILAATVRSRGGKLYTFDEDFRFLGMRRETGGVWIFE
jgi:predicted nucleic acid-binding protein